MKGGVESEWKVASNLTYLRGNCLCVGFVRWQTLCSADCSRQALLAAEQQPQLGAELKHLGERSEVGERGRRTGCCTPAVTGCSREDSFFKVKGC